MTEQRLGILGGMGPQATQDFYQRILDRTDAACDQEHLPTLIWSDTSMPDRTAAILGGDAEGCYRRLLEGARLLERGGCPVLAVLLAGIHLSGCAGDLIMAAASLREPRCTHVRDTETGVDLLFCPRDGSR